MRLDTGRGHNEYSEINYCYSFASLFSASPSHLSVGSCPNAQAPVTHHILTTRAPVHCRPRRLPPENLQVVRMEFEHLLQLGIIRPSSSSWSSAIHMVPKRSQDWRPCEDYRAPNAVAAPDRYPLLNVQVCTALMSGLIIFPHRSRESISPRSCRTCRHPQNHHHNTLRLVWLRSDALRFV